MSKKLLYLCACLCIGWSVNLPQVKAQEMLSEETTHQLNLTRPDRDRPTKVTVGIYLIDFDKFEAIDENFDLDGFLFLTWKDRRLAFNPTQTGGKTKLYKLGQIWSPNVRFRNVDLARETAYTELKVKPDGTVYYKERFHGLFSSQTNLKKFPFDSQQLKLILESPLDDTKNIVLAVDGDKTGKSNLAFLPGWTIGGVKASVTNNNLEVDGLYYPEFLYEIGLSRLSGAYLWNIFIPLLLIVILSWLVFWSKSFEANCGISISCLVSAIAFHIVIAEELPKVAYLTFMNGFILLSYIFIALTLVQIVVKYRLELEKNPELSTKVDCVSRWLFPTMFGVSNFVLIAIFLL